MYRNVIPVTQETEADGSVRIGMPKQHREFKDDLGNLVRLCIKVKPKK